MTMSPASQPPASQPPASHSPASRSRTRRVRGVAALATGLALALAACGGGGDDRSTADDDDRTESTRDESPDTTAERQRPTTTDAPATTVPATTPRPTTTVAGAGLDAVKRATVQIQAQGTFVDPEEGQFESAGSGSGFIIDPSGLAVTNNHVVVGAGLLQVFVPGEDTPRNARVLGVSECSDLAVIDIEGDGFPTLDWATTEAEAGLEIYAAGYPLGDPEFTLTRGIVSKAKAAGDTNWASVDHVIEHDANTQPGNSGGPVVNADGEVVGIHYAGGSLTNTSQFFAIGGDIAQPVVDTLATGENVDSIGVNGVAVYDEDSGLSGVWVSGVESGSPADLTGIAPGDIIQKIEGVTLGADGSMGAYCDVLRTHAPSDPLSVEVLRFSTSELLAGQLNGRPLATTVSFADEYTDDVADADADGAAAPPAEYTSYTVVTDASGAMTMEVPSTWIDVDGTPVDLGAGAPSITASPDIAAFTSGWDVPGVIAVAAAELATATPDELLDVAADVGAATDNCTSSGREPFGNDRFNGSVEIWQSCGGSATELVAVGAQATSGNYGLVIVVQVTGEADLKALDQIINTFDISIA